MAVLCRCQDHFTQGRIHTYTHVAEPLGFPNTSSICGRWQTGCIKPGRIYMTKDAVDAYIKGQRVFNYASNVSQVMLGEKKPVRI